ncbi:hypothetical protein [uncultured Bacteroides sp.]|uniref:hypothetical protein n=1 Tax=uncultured Bacteroides sp. TaxID=162156 RepID=UPI00260972DA|nr:hypothetical protein [uncultured Bacteroides sp.]
MDGRSLHGGRSKHPKSAFPASISRVLQKARVSQKAFMKTFCKQSANIPDKRQTPQSPITPPPASLVRKPPGESDYIQTENRQPQEQNVKAERQPVSSRPARKGSRKGKKKVFLPSEWRQNRTQSSKKKKKRGAGPDFSRKVFVISE